MSVSMTVRQVSIWLFVLIPIIVTAQEQDDFKGTDAVDKAVREMGQTVWFDPESDGLVPVQLEEDDSDTVHRNSRWLPGAKGITQPSSSSTQTSSGWFNSGLTTGHIIGWILLGMTFVFVAGIVLYGFSKIDPGTMFPVEEHHLGAKEQPDAQTLRRIEELPAELRRTDVNLRSEAERLMSQGSLEEAIKCLFGHQLLLLDRGGVIRLTRGKTNGRYVREAAKHKPEIAKILGDTVAVFEASYFGRHAPSQEIFHACWAENQVLEALVTVKAEAAA